MIFDEAMGPMNSDMQKVNLWPNYIGQKTNASHKDIEADLIQFTNDYVKKGLPCRTSPENKELFESAYDIFPTYSSSHAPLQNLEAFLAEGFIELAQAANERVWDARGINVEDLKAEFTSSWFIRYDSGGCVGPHIHGDSSWSCVYYAQIDDGCDAKNGGTYFISPANKPDSSDLGTDYLKATSFDIPAVVGDAVFFPAHLVHGSHPYRGMKKRIIFSSNVRIVAR